MTGTQQLKRLKAAAEKQQKATAARDQLVAESVQAGLPLRQIGAAIGLSHEQARVIAKRVAEEAA